MTKLVIFDVDGTLVDSQAHIVNALETAFTSLALSVPSREQMRSIIGLSLDNAFRRLADTSDDDTIDALVDAYKASFVRGREVAGDGHSMLFDGARDAVLALAQRDDVMLAIATGKSRQGLDVLMRGWDFSHHFISAQVADDHPSKPNPSMVSTCLDDAGLGPKDAVVIGDTTFDMDMAANAGCAAIGVGWGYHPNEALIDCGAREVLTDFAQLEAALERIWQD